MHPDPEIDCAGAPVITLAGREWFVPVLAMRQARVVVPGLMRLMPTLQAMQSGEPGATAGLSQKISTPSSRSCMRRSRALILPFRATRFWTCRPRRRNSSLR